MNKVRCDRCLVPYDAYMWSKAEKNHKQQRNAKLVCKNCRAGGYKRERTSDQLYREWTGTWKWAARARSRNQKREVGNQKQDYR